MRICKLEECNKSVTGRKIFCCAAHRYRYHNIHNPRGRFAYLKNVPFEGKSHLPVEERSSEDDLLELDDFEYYCATTHPFSGEGLGQD
jgi:hypothetical protein